MMLDSDHPFLVGRSKRWIEFWEVWSSNSLEWRDNPCRLVSTGWVFLESFVSPTKHGEEVAVAPWHHWRSWIQQWVPPTYGNPLSQRQKPKRAKSVQRLGDTGYSSFQHEASICDLKCDLSTLWGLNLKTHAVSQEIRQLTSHAYFL